jgi:hypothetical protein
MLLNLLFPAAKCDICNRCHAFNTKIKASPACDEGFNRRGTAPHKTAAKKMNTQLKQNVMQQKKVYCLTYRKSLQPPPSLSIGVNYYKYQTWKCNL